MADFFPDIDNFDSKVKCYSAYEQLHGDMGNSKQFQFSYGNWTVVGHGIKTNYKCGQFRRFDACTRVELHGQSDLSGVSHSGLVFAHMVHHWCHSYSCPVCFLHGACLREAEHGSQRLKFASNGGVDEKGVRHVSMGQPQHVVVSACKADYELANSSHDKFFAKVKRIINEVGILNACLVFHGFRYANYQESIEKGVPFGYYWSPHYHVVGFILGGYGKCRHCLKTERIVHTVGGKTVTKHGDERFCFDCDGFERRVRESFKKYGYIISNLDERMSVFGTLWYQLSHMAIKKRDVV